MLEQVNQLMVRSNSLISERQAELESIIE